MVSPKKDVRGVGIGRGIAAFILNLIAAWFGPGILGGALVYRLMRAYLPSVSTAAERELLASVILATLIAVAVSLCWSTSTAQWVWIFPLAWLLFGMAMFAFSDVRSSVMEGQAAGLWSHFFNPSSIRGRTREALDFTVFTIPAIRTVTYSFIAWAFARWERSRPIDPVVAPAAERPGPMKPRICSGEWVEWLPATNLLIGINIAVFVVMVASGVSPLFPRADQMVSWGGNLGAFTIHGQYWRLMTHSFLHFGILHLTINMLCLWWVGRQAEKTFGGFILTGIYLLAAIGAGLLSLVWAPLRTSQGASGPIMGIAGALIAVVFYGKLKLSSGKLFYRRIIVFILCVLFGGFSPGTDNMAHMGGLIAGLLFGFFFARALRTPSDSKVLATARLFQGREDIERHAYDSAIEHLKTYITLYPDDADGHILLGYSFHALEQYDDAVREYQRALTLGSKDEAIEANLAEIQVRMPDKAVSPIQDGNSSAT